MAFAPRGSRPRVPDQRIDREPLFISSQPPTHPVATTRTASSPKKQSKSRKPPIPKGLTRLKPPPLTEPSDGTRDKSKPTAQARIKLQSTATTTASVNSTQATSTRQKPTILKDQGSRKAHLLSKKEDDASIARSGTKNLKPAVKKEVAPDSLSITAQLAPWVLMRGSLLQSRSKAEIHIEEVLEAERKSLLELEESVDEQRTKLELSGQIELLEDLSRPENKQFSEKLISLIRQFAFFISEQSQTDLASKLDELQDRVYGVEWDPSVYTQLIDRVDDAISKSQDLSLLVDSLVLTSSSNATSLKSSRWGLLLEDYKSLIDVRLQNLRDLRAVIPVVRECQKKKIELEILKLSD